jgi:hypothetical protein
LSIEFIWGRYLDQEKDIDFTVDRGHSIPFFDLGIVDDGNGFDLFGTNECRDGAQLLIEQFSQCAALDLNFD